MPAPTLSHGFLRPPKQDPVDSVIQIIDRHPTGAQLGKTEFVPFSTELLIHPTV